MISSRGATRVSFRFFFLPVPFFPSEPLTATLFALFPLISGLLLMNLTESSTAVHLFTLPLFFFACAFHSEVPFCRRVSVSAGCWQSRS